MAKAPGQQGRKAVLYARLSLDPREDKDSVDSQLGRSRQVVDSLGWQVVGTFSDRNKSGYKVVKLPGRDAALAAIAQGEADTMVAWAFDRFTRQGIAFAFELAAALKNAGGSLVVLNDEDEEESVTVIDTSTAEGEKRLADMAYVARKESEKISRRTRLAHARKAAAGKPHSGIRCFGFDTQNNVVEREASLLREAAQRVVAGESIRAICRDWNARGERTSRGYLWSASSLGQVLRAPKVRGERHVDSQLKKCDGWQPIFSEQEWEQLRDVLDNPGRRSAAGPQRHLLTGIAYCGRCGNLLSRAVQTLSNDRRFEMYSCQPQPQKPGVCGRLGASMESVDNFVVSQALTRVLQAGFPKPADRYAQLEQQLSEQRQRRAALENERYIAGTLSAESYARLTGIIDARIAELKAQTDEEAKRPALSGVEQFFEVDLQRMGDPDYRRSFVLSVVERVDVDPATRRGNKFDTSRVRVTWRAPAPSEAATYRATLRDGKVVRVR